jgi:hypothetical protein
VRNRFDQLGKEIGMKTLGALGPTDTQHALNAETLYADLRHEPEFDPTNAHAPERLRLVAVPVLLHFQHSLEHDATRPLAPEEQEFIMVMHKSWDDARAEGRAEGRAEERTAILRRQLALKFGELPADVDQRIAAARPDEIERLIERVLFAETLDALFPAS